MSMSSAGLWMKGIKHLRMPTSVQLGCWDHAVARRHVRDIELENQQRMRMLKSGCIHELAWAAFCFQLQAVFYSAMIRMPSKE